MPVSSAKNSGSTLFQSKLTRDAHRMVPTHATKAGVRYRYYVSTPFLHGEAKTASAGSVARVPAADIEAVVVKLLKEDLAKQERSITSNVLSVKPIIAKTFKFDGRVILPPIKKRLIWAK